MKYLIILLSVLTQHLWAQTFAGPNSAYYSTLPSCSTCDDDPTTLTWVNNNPLNTSMTVCVNEPVTFYFQGSLCGSDNVVDMGDNCGFLGYWQLYPYFNSPSYNSSFHIDYAYSTPGTYVVSVISGSIFGPGQCIIAKTTINVIPCDVTVSYATCQGSFRPTPGDYVVSFWVKDDIPSPGSVITYSSGIDVVLTGMLAGASTVQIYADEPANSQNRIIDGWQKVEKVITIPPDATGIEIKLKNRQGSSDAYFDDIRFHPFNSSFKSYVYDPVTLRLAAELDERNYATFYEYDEEGQLIRVKKETEKGIKTIKESRASVSK